MTRLLITIITVSIFFTSCNLSNQKPEKEQNKAVLSEEDNFGLSYDEQFKAVVFGNMTLSEVADTNKISLNHLKNKLGIPTYITHDYKIEQIGKNYKFDTNDVAKIINDYKNKQIAKRKATQPKLIKKTSDEQ